MWLSQGLFATWREMDRCQTMRNETQYLFSDYKKDDIHFNVMGTAKYCHEISPIQICASIGLVMK